MTLGWPEVNTVRTQNSGFPGQTARKSASRPKVANEDMLTPDQALQTVLDRCRPLAARQVPLNQAVGRRLAETVQADRDYPPFNRAMMDGYAICPIPAGPSREFQVVGQLAAGEVGLTEVRPGECVEIMTGAACPPGTHAVVPFEVTDREGTTLRVREAWKPQLNIVLRGADCAAHSVLQQPGDLVTPLCIAILASLGKSAVYVVPTPRIAVLTTGGELASADQPLGPAQIRDSNGPMVAAMCATAGAPPARVAHVPDDRHALIAALETASDCELVILTGGVSTGKFDLVPAAIQEVGGEVIFHKVSQKPGMPLLFAQRGEQYILGLPGNPLAVHFCFHRYAATAIRTLTSHPHPRLTTTTGILTNPVRPNDGRSWFVLARAQRSRSAGEAWQLTPLPGHSSADIFGPRQANCYLEVPPSAGVRQAGDSLTFEWLAEADAPL